MVNSGGLNSGNLAALAGIDQDAAGYRINYSKGEYLRIGNGKETLTTRLIYPVPPSDGSVGIHTCPDTGGGMRLGPFDSWVEEVEYSVDEGIRETMFQAVHPFLPFLEPEDLQPDSAGIHPKVQRRGEPMADYIVCHETEHIFPGADTPADIPLQGNQPGVGDGGERVWGGGGGAGLLRVGLGDSYGPSLARRSRIRPSCSATTFQDGSCWIFLQASSSVKYRYKP